MFLTSLWDGKWGIESNRLFPVSEAAAAEEEEEVSEPEPEVAGIFNPPAAGGSITENLSSSWQLFFDSQHGYNPEERERENGF